MKHGSQRLVMLGLALCLCASSAPLRPRAPNSNARPNALACTTSTSSSPAKGEDLTQASAAKGEILTQAGEHPFEMTTSFRVNGEANPKRRGTALRGDPRRPLYPDAGLRRRPDGGARLLDCGLPHQIPRAMEHHPRLPRQRGGRVRGSPARLREGGKATFFSPVYNLEPSPGVVARFGFWAANIPVTIDANLSEDSPNLIVAGPTNTPQLVEVMGSIFTLWGVPADPAHDPLRGRCIKTANGESRGECPVERRGSRPSSPCHATATGLSPPPTTPAPGWAARTRQALTHDEAGNPQGMTGCGASRLLAAHFRPAPSARSAASPSGLEFRMEFADEGLTNPTGQGRLGSEQSRADPARGRDDQPLPGRRPRHLQRGAARARDGGLDVRRRLPGRIEGRRA